jgi:hypothetical protein
MSASEVENSLGASDTAISDATKSLRRVQREMLRVASTAVDKPRLLQGLAQLLYAYTRPLAMHHFGRNDQGEVGNPTRLIPFDADSRGDRLAAPLAAACQAACRSGEPEIRHIASPPRILVAAPIPQLGAEPHALAVIYSVCDTTPHLLLLTQLVVSHIVLWENLVGRRERENEVRDASAIVELVEHMNAAADVRTACYELAEQLARHLGCRRVVIGLRTEAANRCRLAAISGVAQFDPRSESAQAWEAAMDEAILRGDATRWPAANDEQRLGALAHRTLVSREEAKRVFSQPLVDARDKAVGVVMAVDDSERADDAAFLEPTAVFLRAAAQPLATALDAAQRLEGGAILRGGRLLQRGFTGWRGRGAMILSLLAGLAMFLPWPYRIASDCRIEPVTRRYVAAPFEGTLERAFVKPGDVVGEGDLLALMDGRELRWKRAAVVADLNQARKKRDAAQAAHNYSEQQIARLEMERLEVELRVLDHRAENLEIRSPVAGVIASGDLERAEGAPLQVGQTLFEVGPLEKMIIEVAVHDDEVSYVCVGQPLEVRLDAYPRETWSAALERLHPRSEIRDGENVFVAEAELDNAQGRLRPGMKGRAKLVVGWRPLGWVLFHKPWEYTTKTIAW